MAHTFRQTGPFRPRNIDPRVPGLVFTGCYALGAVAALATALVARRTILQGPAAPMVLELPPYRLPSLRTAFITTVDRGLLFLRKAGTVILAICIVLWWMGAYPQTTEPTSITDLRAQAESMVDARPDEAAALLAEADERSARHVIHDEEEIT